MRIIPPQKYEANENNITMKEYMITFLVNLEDIIVSSLFEVKRRGPLLKSYAARPSFGRSESSRLSFSAAYVDSRDLVDMPEP